MKLTGFEDLRVKRTITAIYQARSNGQWDIDWVMEHTVFLHFAGRDKPWKPGYTTRYVALYKYLERQIKKGG